MINSFIYLKAIKPEVKCQQYTKVPSFTVMHANSRLKNLVYHTIKVFSTC